MQIQYILFFIFLLNFIKFSNSQQQIITLKKNNFVSVDDTISDINVKKWSKQMSKLTSNPMYVYIDSLGGSINAGLQFINNMNWYIAQGKIINCIVKSAYSMGFIILQHCTNRYVMSSASLMQHQMSLYGIKGPINNLMNYFEMIKNISNELDQKVSLRLNITIEEYRNKITNDWWLTADSAIVAGAADSLVIVGCEPELYGPDTKQEEPIFSIGDDENLELEIIPTIKDLCPL